ncbi:integrase [Micromonospora sp. NPDC047738]|uniref:integrase n=1 Tax=Micromonospora sp. NPDC047738 TaxID=3155741 RepID=UPI0033C9C2A3
MSADLATVAAARQVLAHLGVTLADLESDAGVLVSLPTVAEYLPRVIAAAGPGARRTYGTYWERMAAAWGDWPLNRVAASDIEAMKQEMIATARSRRNSRNGRHAGEHVIAAARAFYLAAMVRCRARDTSRWECTPSRSSSASCRGLSKSTGP